jgi:hypothetical protein
MSAERNQCDGCAVGASINEWGNHCMPDGSRMGCTAERYVDPKPTRLALCEAGRIVPRPHQTYVFVEMPNCPECQRIGDEQQEAYGARSPAP